jgi:hypothetical protein
VRLWGRVQHTLEHNVFSLAVGHKVSKAKTRVLVDTHGVTNELFAVREVGDKTLQIFLKAETYSQGFKDPAQSLISRNFGDLTRTIQSKISVHPSWDTDGTTIKFQETLEDGRTLTAAAFVENSQTSLLFPVFGKLVPKQTKEAYRANPKSRDRLYNLLAFDDELYALVYNVWVSRGTAKVPTYPSYLNSRLDIPFTEFSLTVFYGYAWYPSFNLGITPVVATSPFQDTPNPVKPELKGKPSVDEQTFLDQLPKWLGSLQLMGAARLVHEMHRLGEEHLPPWTVARLRTLLARPLENFPELEGQKDIEFSIGLPISYGSKSSIALINGHPVGTIFPGPGDTAELT